MIRDLLCRCDCGERTAIVNLPPGSVLESRYFGLKTGHGPVVHAEIIRPERMRRAALLRNVSQVMGLVGKRLS